MQSSTSSEKERKEQEKRDNLPCLLNAHKKLKKEIDKQDKTLPATDSQKLQNKIFEELEDILNQRYWFTDELDEKKALTQSDLIDKARDIYLKSLNKTYLKLLAIRKVIIDFNPEYVYSNELLRFILISINQTLADLEKNRKTGVESQPLKLNQDEEEYYSSYYLTQYLANQLGGSYFPHRQEDDPLFLNNIIIIEEERGVCFGDLEAWVDHVNKGKKSILSVRADEKVMEKQINQKKYIQEYTVSSIREFYGTTADIWIIIQDIIFKLKENFFYGVAFYPLERLRSNGHVMGIYKNSAGQIIFRDSNDVTTSFQSISNFKIFIFYYFCDIYKVGSSKEFSEGSISLMQWKDQPISPSITIPDVKNDKTRAVELKAMTDQEHTSQGFESLHSQLQIIAALPKDEKMPAMIYKTFEDENNSFKNCLKKKFKCTEQEKSTGAFVDYMKAYQQKLKSLTLTTLDKQIANIQKFQKENPVYGQKPEIKDSLELLNNIKQDIYKAGVDETLISIVDRHLKDQPNKAIRELVKKHEIHPGCVLILQQKLLRMLCKLSDKDWSPIVSSGTKIEEESKKIPTSIAKVRALLKGYYQHDLVDMPGLLRQIQLIFAAKNSGFFARARNRRSRAMEEFDSIMKKLDTHNPSSLQEVFAQIQKFEEKYLKPALKEQPKPIVSSSPRLIAA